MTISVDTLLDGAMQLPPPLRAYLAEQLLESLDMDAGAPLSQAWRDTLVQRAKAVEEGLVVLQSAEAVFQDAYRALE